MKHITVFGAGTMGIGVAHVAAMSGFTVVLNDISPGILEVALKNIKQNLQKGFERKKITSSQLDSTLERIILEPDLERAAKNADLVIETIVEELDIKLSLFQKLDQICKSETIFATNTSALSITELAAVTNRADRFVGMHFFNPAHKMRLVEIIKGLETHDETIDGIRSIVKTMGKDSVVVSDSPGFVTSRINVMIGNEAFFMLQEGIASAQDIDKALKLGLNHPMGPFELVDLVGLDIRLKVLRDLYKRLGEKFRPCPLLEKYVHAGRLGRKVGRGVYEYKD